MKIKPGKVGITAAVLFLATLMTVDMSQARGMGGGGTGGGGMGGSSGSSMSGGSGMGGGGSFGSGDHMNGDLDQDRDQMRLFQDSSNRAYRNISTGAMSGMGVLMDLKPEGFKDGKLYVHYSARTQSGNLGNYDLKKQSTLEYGGRAIHPREANHMNGRHAEGIMAFDVGEMPEHFSIIINGIPGENQRINKW